MAFFEDDEKKKDWRECLSDEDRAILESMMSEIKRFACAYDHAENPHTAQIWTYLIELRKELRDIKEKLGKVEAPFQAIISAGDAEKRKTIEKIVTEMVRPTDAETQEATKKLVESLMRF